MKPNNELNLVVKSQHTTKKLTKDGTPCKMYFRLLQDRDDPEETLILMVCKYILVDAQSLMNLEENSFVFVKKYKGKWLCRNMFSIQTGTLGKALDKLYNIT